MSPLPVAPDRTARRDARPAARPGAGGAAGRACVAATLALVLPLVARPLVARPLVAQPPASPPAGPPTSDPALAADTTGDTVTTRAVAPGVALRRIARPAGPWVITVLTLDLRTPGLRVETAHANDALAGRERPTAIHARWCEPGRRAVATVNGDLFDLKTGESEGSQIVAGTILKGVATTDSPHDTFDNAHAQFAMTDDGRPLIGRWQFAGALVGGGARVPLEVNAPRAPGAALFTPAAGARTPDDSTRRDVVEVPYAVRLPRKDAAPWPRAGDPLRLRRAGEARRGGGTPIPPNGVVVAARAGTPAAELLASPAAGELTAELAFAPDPGPLRALMGGWGRLVDGGAVVAERADSLEGTFPRFSANRHPRTAVGITRGGDTLLLVVVDGRSARSVGMSFRELGLAMRALGAWEAVNLDGGGSTAMVIDGALVNSPSDATGERTVGNVLVVSAPAPGRTCAASGMRRAP